MTDSSDMKRGRRSLLPRVKRLTHAACGRRFTLVTLNNWKKTLNINQPEKGNKAIIELTLLDRRKKFPSWFKLSEKATSSKFNQQFINQYNRLQRRAICQFYHCIIMDYPWYNLVIILLNAIPLFCTAHHLVRIPLRLQTWW